MGSKRADVVEVRDRRGECFFVRRSAILAVIWNSEVQCLVEDCHEFGCFIVLISRDAAGKATNDPRHDWLYCLTNPLAPNDTREGRILADLMGRSREYRV